MFKPRLGIRTRILAIALVPSLTVMGIGVGASGYLVREGQRAKGFAQTLQSGITAEKAMIAAIQQERLQSVRYLTGTGTSTPLQAMSGARGNLDQAFTVIGQIATQMTENSQGQILFALDAFYTVVHEIPIVRGGIDAGSLSVSDAYGFYNKLLDSVSRATVAIGRTAPDSDVPIRSPNSIA